MKKWMKLIPFSYLAAGMIWFSPAEALDGGCNPCFSCCGSECCFIDDWSVAIDFLWWKPCIDDLAYAFMVEEYDVENKIEYKNLCPGWEPGVRVVLGRPCFYCDWGIVASYTHFNSHEHSKIGVGRSVSSPLIHPFFLTYMDELFDEVKADWEMCYQEFDALVTYDMSCCNPCHLFQPFAGFAGIYLEQDLDIEITDYEETYDLEWSSEFWGFGIRAGIEYQYLINRCLRFYTLVHGTLLVGEPDNEANQSFMLDLEIDDDECCLFVPGYHIGLGLIYDACICGVGVSARVGYEFLEWNNLPNHRIFTGEDLTVSAGHATSSNVRTIGFHGWSAGIGVTF